MEGLGIRLETRYDTFTSAYLTDKTHLTAPAVMSAFTLFCYVQGTSAPFHVTISKDLTMVI